jgi:hypothetical protein
VCYWWAVGIAWPRESGSRSESGNVDNNVGSVLLDQCLNGLGIVALID